MPLWRIFHPAGLYSPEDKTALAKAITAIYTNPTSPNLPAFYVDILFLDYAPGSFFVGGEAVADFVRFAGEHIARSISPDDIKRMRTFMSSFEEAITPWTAGKGVRWETHVDQTPFELWRVNGLPPPPPRSEAEDMWRERGVAMPYEGMV